jgi:hypothetical protein
VTNRNLLRRKSQPLLKCTIFRQLTEVRADRAERSCPQCDWVSHFIGESASRRGFEPGTIIGRESQLLGLKLYLSMFSNRIFESSVDRAMPSLAAAPEGPNTRPWLSRRASSITSFSVAATFWER